MVSKRRSKLKIMENILSLIEFNPVLKTHIFYGLKLSYTQHTEYLQTLESLGLIEIRKENSNYKVYITERGREALSILRKLREYIPDV